MTICRVRHHTRRCPARDVKCSTEASGSHGQSRANGRQPTTTEAAPATRPPSLEGHASPRASATVRYLECNRQPVSSAFSLVELLYSLLFRAHPTSYSTHNWT